ncbi:MAG: hypothetical protein DRG35_00130 [Deltaproteobacteria bacterium]|nr:hypothetical protein [Deltaproteobacteria bacterium]OQY14912.1 MAG: hypothetical protein B6I32_08415 [Desulfobacterium sp. 4572_20]HDH88150.1 hypothetical protein [Desulfobacteraceae bacterium]MBW2104759.1 hypothetical protein [Deltaproteobacteria bacterium]MBW2333201.1 hypothetical protein [Deltaproteobacteria bacterium]
MDPVDMLSTVNLGVPLYMVISFVAVISLCLLFSRIQLGLAVSYLFVFYIGYFYNKSLLLKTIEGSITGTVIYVCLGLIIIILAIISFISPNK